MKIGFFYKYRLFSIKGVADLNTSRLKILLPSLVTWLVPDALTLVEPTRVQLLVFLCLSNSVISCCRVLIVVSPLYSFDFYVFGGIAKIS